MSDISFTDSKTYEVWLPKYVVEAMQGTHSHLVVIQDVEQNVLHYYVNGVEAKETV